MGWTMNLVRFERGVMERSAVRNIRTQEGRRSGRKNVAASMSDDKDYDIPAELAIHAHIDYEKYAKLHERSITDPERFCTEQAERLVTRFEPWEKVAW